MSTLKSLSQELATLIEEAGRSVLRVKGARHPASATVWTDTLAVLPTHVLGPRDEGFVTLPDGKDAAARVIGRDPTTDLSLLSIEGGGLTAPRWVDHEEVRVGNLVVTVGRPGSSVRSALGMVGGKGPAWVTRMGGPIAALLDVDGELPRGFAGGPLVGLDGGFLGINTHALLRGGTTVPTATVRRVVEQLREHGEVKPGFLGVGVQATRLPEEVAQEIGRDTAPLVTQLTEDGPAAQAGVHAGDFLVAVDGAPLVGFEDLLAALSGRAGQTVKLSLRRGGQAVEVEATATERPGPRTGPGWPFGGRRRQGRRHPHQRH